MKRGVNTCHLSDVSGEATSPRKTASDVVFPDFLNNRRTWTGRWRSVGHYSRSVVPLMPTDFGTDKAIWIGSYMTGLHADLTRGCRKATVVRWPRNSQTGVDLGGWIDIFIYNHPTLLPLFLLKIPPSFLPRASPGAILGSCLTGEPQWDHTVRSFHCHVIIKWEVPGVLSNPPLMAFGGLFNCVLLMVPVPFIVVFNRGPFFLE